MPKFIPCAVCGTPVEIPAGMTEVRRAYCPDHIGGKVIKAKAKPAPAPEPVAVEAPPKPKAKKRGRPKKKPDSGSSAS